MRETAFGILAAFVALLAVSIYIAEKAYDGTVEENYYRKSLDFFRDKPGPGVQAPSWPGVAFAGKQKVLLDIAPRPPMAMRELTFSVEAPGYVAPGSPWLDLGMTGMQMPPNRIELARDETGRYRGRGILVKCASGMRTWTATLHLPGTGTALFTFDVAD